jgi:hypothetical protein
MMTILSQRRFVRIFQNNHVPLMDDVRVHAYNPRPLAGMSVTIHIRSYVQRTTDGGNYNMPSVSPGSLLTRFWSQSSRSFAASLWKRS